MAEMKKRPVVTPLRQQKLRAWRLMGTPNSFIALYALVGAVFVAVGTEFLELSQDLVWYREQYDGVGTPDSNADCRITEADVGLRCNVTVRVKKRMEKPVHVFYEIDDFYQNHRSYVQSVAWSQLHEREHNGRKRLKQSDNCPLLYENNSRLLNPCGVIPNTLFNDVFTSQTVRMKENKIAWRTDVKEVIKQPEGVAFWRNMDANASDPCFETLGLRCTEDTCALFDSPFLDDCFGYVCKGSYHDEFKCEAGERVVFHYDETGRYQYLYETFPQVISPLVGVNSEHFAVWLRAAALPRFRKLYGRIPETIPKDTDLVFTIENNWDVHAFGGKKFLVVATAHGFQNQVLAWTFLVIGFVCFGLGALFWLIQKIFKLRKLGDTDLIPWIRN